MAKKLGKDIPAYFATAALVKQTQWHCVLYSPCCLQISGICCFLNQKLVFIDERNGANGVNNIKTYFLHRWRCGKQH